MGGGRSVHVLEMCTRVDSEQLSSAESLSGGACVNGFVVFPPHV